MQRYQYVTTIGTATEPGPVQPTGDGWDMCGAAAVAKTSVLPWADTVLYWFWRRPIKEDE